MRYRFISVRQDYSVARWAKFLDVSRSGFYAWKKDTVRRDAAEASYHEAVRKIFAEGEGTYGPERISGIMRERGHKASFRKVRAHMERDGLRSIHCRRRSHSLTDSTKSRGEGFPNLTKGIEINSPFQVLTSDISYIRTGEGFEYLCQVKDVVSGVVLASSMMSRMKAELVEQTIGKALGRWRVPAGCIFHSDRGSQYTSDSVKQLLINLGLRQSFSRVGKPGDNAWSESFFANLKKESVHWAHFETREQARQAMFAYIEGFYNTRRAQKRLGYLSPMEWLKNWYHENEKLVA